MSGIGGLCIVNNLGFKNLLQALRYNVVLIPGAVMNEFDHAVILAKIEERQYLVDIGCGYPKLQAIPLDFDEESKVYKFSFVKFYFVRKGDVIERFQSHSRLVPPEFGEFNESTPIG